MPPFQPIDLYFVFDLSFSMKPDLEKLQQYSSVLFEKFWCLFPDEEKESFHVGIGTFIDKDGFQKYSLLIGRWYRNIFLKTILSDFHQLCQKMTHFNTTHVWLKKVSENANQIMFSKIMFNSQATPTNLKKNSKKLWRQIFKFIDIFAKILLKSHLKINPRMVSAATLTSMKLDWMHLFNQQYVKISAGVKEQEKWLFMLPMLVFIHKEMACSEILSSFWINKTICL